MASVADEIAEMRRLLEGLPRKQLQTIAKEYNIRANSRSSDIIDDLLRSAISTASADGSLDHHARALQDPDAFVSCFPGTSAIKAGVASQLATFGKALVGLVTGSPANERHRPAATNSGGSASGPGRPQQVPARDAQLIKDQRDDAPASAHALPGGDAGVGPAGQDQQQRQSQRGDARGLSALSSLQHAAAPELPLITARMQELAVGGSTCVPPDSQPAACNASQLDAGPGWEQPAACNASQLDAGPGWEQPQPTLMAGVPAGPSTADPAAHTARAAAASGHNNARQRRVSAASAPARRHSSPSKRLAVRGREVQLAPHPVAPTAAQRTSSSSTSSGAGAATAIPGDANACPQAPTHVLHTPQRMPAAAARARHNPGAGGGGASSGSPAAATHGATAGRSSTPLRQGAEDATTRAAAGQLLSPRALGTAKRIVPPLAAADAQRLLATGGKGALLPGRPGAKDVADAAPMATTPLRLPPRRLMPGAACEAAAPISARPEAAAGRGATGQRSGAGADLEAQVAWALIANPGAHPGALQGPEAAKQWLQRRIVQPYARAPSSMGAGYCYAGVLLSGPPGCGKTELARALAAGLRGRLLYLPAERVAAMHEQQGHVQLRALFQVARQAAPCVVCLDDAHLGFPAVHSADPAQHPSHRLRTELLVQLEQLADEQAALSKASAASGPASGAAAISSCETPGQHKRPLWNSLVSPASSRPPPDMQPSAAAPPAPRQAHPIVVLAISSCPERVDPALVAALKPLVLEPPAAATREDLLLHWLLERDAGLGVADVEQLVRATAGWSVRDLLGLCQTAHQAAAKQGPGRPVNMADFGAALALRKRPGHT